MPRIRKVQIENFRGIEMLSWLPCNGINCLIGAGDSGKSTIIDAIDLCLGSRRSYQFSDDDFHKLRVETPIRIRVTIGALSNELLSLDAYSLFLRSFSASDGKIYDEPGSGLETVLTLSLTVDADLEPTWELESSRASARGVARGLTRADQQRVAPTRIGSFADYNLGWRRGSVLNRLSEARPDASAALVRAVRSARERLGAEAEGELRDVLGAVTGAAINSGIEIGQQARALLDAHSVDLSSGTIALHNAEGVPLRRLGLGSSRLLIAELQRLVSESVSIVLIDEVEHGLEPHRIASFLRSVGAKDHDEPLQVVMSTHSPIVITELSVGQLFRVLRLPDRHRIVPMNDSSLQGTVRKYAYAFLARSVVVCEGASEVGLVRGLDLYQSRVAGSSAFLRGAVPIDGGGGKPGAALQRALAFLKLRYRTCVVLDRDVQWDPTLEAEFIKCGGQLFTWQDKFALEDALFNCLPQTAALRLVEFARNAIGPNVINDQIRTASGLRLDLSSVTAKGRECALTSEDLRDLATASKSQDKPWFKSVSTMEKITVEVIGPALSGSDPAFKSTIENLCAWMHGS